MNIVVHWPRFGPYHIARITRAFAHLNRLGMRLIGVEIASRDQIYSWRDDAGQPLPECHVAFPGRYVEEIGIPDLWRGLSRLLDHIKPAVIAINGYGSKDSLVMLAWSHWRRVPAILMSDSKADDFTRNPVKEAIKSWLVSQYAGGLCAGTLHKEYLVRLGMNPDLIRLGYDAVDNEYFWQGAQAALGSPIQFRNMPGLESEEPFFLVSSRWVARKNIPGVLLAYHQYRQQMISSRIAPWRLVVLGDGPQASEIKQIIAQKQIDDVYLPGFRQYSDLPAYYGLASVFIHAPLQEQWGLVVNEAMASGLPVLVSKQCGCSPDLVIEGINGFTFDAWDTNHLANLMAGFTRGEFNRSMMGAASHTHIQDWGLDRFACGLEQLVNICQGES